MIVHHDTRRVWVVGQAISGDARHDLLAIDLATGSSTIVTAGINTDGWGALDAMHVAGRWLLAFAHRGLVAFENNTIEALCPLPVDVALAELGQWDDLVAMFASASAGARIIVGDTRFQTVDVPGEVRWPSLEKATCFSPAPSLRPL